MSTEDKSDNSQDNFYEELEQVGIQLALWYQFFPKKILPGKISLCTCVDTGQQVQECVCVCVCVYIYIYIYIYIPDQINVTFWHWL